MYETSTVAAVVEVIVVAVATDVFRHTIIGLSVHEVRSKFTIIVSTVCSWFSQHSADRKAVRTGSLCLVSPLALVQ